MTSNEIVNALAKTGQFLVGSIDGLGATNATEALVEAMAYVRAYEKVKADLKAEVNATDNADEAKAYMVALGHMTFRLEEEHDKRGD